MSVERLAVVGTGLIGASVALAARRGGVPSVVGAGIPTPSSSASRPSAARSMPSPVADEAVRRRRPRRRRGARSGSCRRPSATCSSARRTQPPSPTSAPRSGRCPRPRAATRASSAATRSAARRRAARARATAELFDGATWFLTPTAATEPERLRLVHGFVAGLGARPVAIGPDAHDRLVAVTSHLPHVLANVLLNQAGSARIDGHDPLQAAGGSLRDMTRIGGANPRIWVDIFLDNREALQAALAEQRRLLEQVEEALAGGDAGFLARWIGEASGHRRRMLETAFVDPGTLHRVRTTSPTARACSPGSSRRSARSGSTSRTSSSTTSPPSAAARSRCSSPARARRTARPSCSRRRATASSSRR